MEDRINKQLRDQHIEWEQKVAHAESLAAELKDRFADWYYVITSTSFDGVRLDRSDLLKDKPADS